MIFVFLGLGPAFLSITLSALGPSVVELFYLSEQQKFIHVTIYCLSKGANFYQEMPTSLVQIKIKLCGHGQKQLL